jgi:hypothetical protein
MALISEPMLEGVLMYARLAADLKRLAAREYPAPEDLATAPFLGDWHCGWRQDPCMNGYVWGQPQIPDAEGCTTSVAVAADLREGHRWLRTRSRLYRLGTPHPSLPLRWE